MPAIAKLSPKRKESLKLLNIAGCDDKELAKRFRIRCSTIRKMRYEDKAWSSAFTKVRKEMKLKRKEHNADVLAEVGETTIQTLKNRGELGNMAVSKMTLNSLQKFSKRPPRIVEWSEANTAFNMLRKSTGQEQGNQVAVQVNLGGLFNPSAESPVVQMD